MKIVKAYARMLEIQNVMEGIEMLQKIEYFARISHASEDKITADSYDKFLRSVVLQHGDMSVIEHEKVSCEFLVDRGITHEIVRHRIGSYTQESTRFINYKKKGGEAKFINPGFRNDIPVEEIGKDEHLAFNEWEAACEAAESRYMALLDSGVAPQIARSVLPNALASKIAVTYNLRTWRHFFLMRTSKEAHPQMREVTIPLLKDFQERIPILYEDIIPEQRQADNMRLLR